MRIANLCCHCKNFIQNAYRNFVLSLQEFYPKCILQSYAVIARILFKMHIPKSSCHCKNFMQNAYCKYMLSLQEFYLHHTLQLFFGVFLQNNATSFEQRAVGSATMIFPAQLHHLLISRQENRALTLKLIEKLIVRGRI